MCGPPATIPRCRVSGIGDNFQLHTLLAVTLIGDPGAGLIAGERPQAAWIAAATDGDPEPPGSIRGQFNLVDAAGERSWNAGRAYPLMVPEIRLDRVLSAEEAAAWSGRIKPANR